MKLISYLSLTLILLMNTNSGQSQNTTGVVDLNNLYDYLNYDVPQPVLDVKDPLQNSDLTNEIITLGRVLFYDKNLSVNNTVSCASCHKQEFAFGDTAIVSQGWNGEFTKRHTPKLINLHYGSPSAFWDTRNWLDNQPIETIGNPIEMGFSGTNGQPGIHDLAAKLAAIDYYPPLFESAFRDPTFNIYHINDALVQFFKSIVSFDSKYDAGLKVSGIHSVFPNFTPQENRGKKLVSNRFTVDVENDILKCASCHEVPIFNSLPLSGNNGIIGVAGEPDSIDLMGLKPPSLRDMINPNGMMNGPLMHDGSISSFREMIDHYDSIPLDPRNNNLSHFLFEDGKPQVLNLDEDQKLAIEAFFKTLTGSDVYTNPKWSNPFNEDGTLTILPRCDNNDAVSIVGLPTAVSSNDPIQLNGNPAGGVFSGPSVAFNIFNPSQVLPGFHEITYTYLNEDGCSIQVSENILVAEISYNFITYNLGTISPKIMLGLEVLDNSNQPITVSNLNGSIIFNTDQWFEKGDQQFVLDTNGWHKGIYLVKIGQHTKPEKVYVY